MVLKERVTGEMLAVGVFDPAGDDRLVRQTAGALEVSSPDTSPDQFEDNHARTPVKTAA